MNEDSLFVCDNCGRGIDAADQKYIMKVEMFASADPPIITEEMLKGDLVDKMNEIVEQMKDMDPQELEDQVFESYEFEICPACRDMFHRGFSNLPGNKKQF